MAGVSEKRGVDFFWVLTRLTPSFQVRDSACSSNVQTVGLCQMEILRTVHKQGATEGPVHLDHSVTPPGILHLTRMTIQTYHVRKFWTSLEEAAHTRYTIRGILRKGNILVVFQEESTEQWLLFRTGQCTVKTLSTNMLTMSRSW